MYYINESTYGFLYSGYRDSLWFWEYFSLARKLSISGIIIFFSSSLLNTSDTTMVSVLKSLAALFVLVVALLLTSTLRPYHSNRMNLIEGVGLAVSALNMVSVLSLPR